jgi:dihydrofolate reductase
VSEERKSVRKLVVYELLSLDGVAEHPEDWLRDVDPELDGDLMSAVAHQDAVLLGRHTYDEWAKYWPGASDFPAFADFINRVPKHVFTATPLRRPWSGTVVANTAAVDYVRALKAGTGADIGVHGSISLARSLLRAGLVDELRLVISPVLVGAGRTLFDGPVGPGALQLTGSAATPSGHLLVRYGLTPGT